jgi:hypothetical protein
MTLADQRRVLLDLDIGRNADAFHFPLAAGAIDRPARRGDTAAVDQRG